MLQAQKHRGPDAIGEWSAEQIWLGHNRLSIIDLSAAANQPMHSRDGRFVIVFNGEIYNYKELIQQYSAKLNLTTLSDTEVLLELFALKGEAILHELIGMFAFAIWDKKEHTLFAARDRFGVKPFFYSKPNNAFLFASEIKTIHAAGIAKEPDTATWSGYLTQGTYGEPSTTFWKNIYQLPGGHCLTYQLATKKITINKWYEFETQLTKSGGCNELELMETYESLLTNAVSLRFRSDVPVGVAVSGGLDSSLLLATIAQTQVTSKQLYAYTFYSHNEVYNELPWVNALIEQHNLFVQDAVLFDWKDIPIQAEKMAAQQDEPYGGFPTIAYANIFAKASFAGVKVLLDGQGMDEAWAGYDYYWNNSDSLIQGGTTTATQSGILDAAFAAKALKFQPHQPFDNKLQNLQYRDLFYTKLPRALRFNDRASMLHSLELREPFLDHRLVEFAFSLPAGMKYVQGLPKWQLRKLAEKWMHSKISLAPKRPVQTPQREWLKNELKDWANTHLHWLATKGNPGWFEAKKMLSAWKQYCDGTGDNSFFIWQWINTALLLQSNRQY